MNLTWFDADDYFSFSGQLHLALVAVGLACSLIFFGRVIVWSLRAFVASAIALAIERVEKKKEEK